MINKAQQAALVAVKAEIDRIADLQAQIETQKQRIQDVATEVLAELPEEDQQTVAIGLYWLFPIVKVSSIAEALGFSRVADVCKYVGKGSIELQCQVCKKWFVRQVSSRGEASLENSIRGHICSDCRETSSQAWQQAQLKVKEKEEKREREIERLRTMPYSEYLQTTHWQEVRANVLRHAKYRCQLCNAKNTQLHVHHKTYEHRGFEHWDDLIVLCAACHRKFHDIELAASAD